MIKTKPIIKKQRKVERLDLFSTPVSIVKFSDDETDRLKLIDESYRLNKVNPIGIQRSNYGGWHSENNLYDNLVFKKLNNLIMDFIDKDIIPKNYLNFRGNINFDACWVTINKTGDFNMPHEHDGTWLSGIFYMKIPPILSGGELKLLDNNRVRKHEEWKFKDKNSNMYTFKPENGKFIMFPSWLWHMVEPNKSTEDRISYSFTLKYK